MARLAVPELNNKQAGPEAQKSFEMISCRETGKPIHIERSPSLQFYVLPVHIQLFCCMKCYDNFEFEDAAQ